MPIKKELGNSKRIRYKLKFIDSFRFMSTSLSSICDDLSEIYRKKCKNKNCKSASDFIGIKYIRLLYKFKCKKEQLEPTHEITKKSLITHKFCNNDLNKFILLLRKGAYPYEYMDSWERFDETSLPDKKAFYSELYLEDITDKGYAHAQKVFEELKLKNLGDYHDLYVQSDTLLLVDGFETLKNKCIEIHELDPAHLLSAPGLAWQACFKKTNVKLE